MTLTSMETLQDWQIVAVAYEAALQALDTELGRLYATSVDLDNTNIIIIGDNGTPGAVAQDPFDTYPRQRLTLRRRRPRAAHHGRPRCHSLTGTQSTNSCTASTSSATILELAGISTIDTCNCSSVDTIDSKSLCTYS
jgi:hypothetical protein